MALGHIIPPSTIKPKLQSNNLPTYLTREKILASSFHPTTILLIGACLQGAILLLYPYFIALLPSVVLLGLRIVDTIAITFKFKPNPYLKNAILDKWTALVPNISGQISETPANEKIAVFLLCFKVNHPLGFFASHVKDVGVFANKMYADLENNMQNNNGFLGQSNWTSVDENGAIELLVLSYWRCYEDVVNYSQGKQHREAWNWWNEMHQQNKQQIEHIGISHEVFECPRSSWENVSINFQPTRLGATMFFQKEEGKWVSPIVEAKGKLRTSKGRFNWQPRVENPSNFSIF